MLLILIVMNAEETVLFYMYNYIISNSNVILIKTNTLLGCCELIYVTETKK